MKSKIKGINEGRKKMKKMKKPMLKRSKGKGKKKITGK